MSVIMVPDGVPWPTDLEAERQSLGALLVMDYAERDRWTLKLRAEMYYDPFHEWLFRSLRKARRKVDREVFEFVYRECRAPDWILRNLGINLSGLFTNCGQVRMMARYLARLSQMEAKRSQLVSLQDQMVSLLGDQIVAMQRLRMMRDDELDAWELARTRLQERDQ